MDKVYLKVFKNSRHTLVAVCDCNLLGKTFREGKLKLEVKNEFYGGTLSTMEEAIKALGSAQIANLVGARIIEAAVKSNLVNPKAVIFIAGVPHVQIFKL
jgi:hypothetical protein